MENNCCISGVRGAAVAEPRNETAEFAIDRQGGDYKEIVVAADPTGQHLQGGLRGRHQMPGLDLFPARLHLECRALFPQA